MLVILKQTLPMGLVKGEMLWFVSVAPWGLVGEGLR